MKFFSQSWGITEIELSIIKIERHWCRNYEDKQAKQNHRIN